MEKLSIHLISFDVPYPADYGGVIDVYYKIKALNEVGVNVHLHCFQYGREGSEELEKICASVNYYRRNMGAEKLISRTPYIVKSRTNNTLLFRLQEDNFPILFEGLHTAGLMNDKALANRMKILRSHNIEHEYYRGLASVTGSLSKRIYYNWEAIKLERFERIAASAELILAISKGDQIHFSSYGDRVDLMFPFHATVDPAYVSEGAGYIFYHGNLTVSENIEAIQFLIEEVMPLVNIKLVVAGKGTEALSRKFNHPSVIFVNSPSDEEMLNLSRNANIHVLPTFQNTGFKLKLLYALVSGRHVLVNSKMLDGTDLGNWTSIAESPQEWAEGINKLMDAPFEKPTYEARQEFLEANYSNKEKAERLKLLIQNSSR